MQCCMVRQNCVAALVHVLVWLALAVATIVIVVPYCLLVAMGCLVCVLWVECTLHLPLNAPPELASRCSDQLEKVQREAQQLVNEAVQSAKSNGGRWVDTDFPADETCLYRERGAVNPLDMVDLDGFARLSDARTLYGSTQRPKGVPLAISRDLPLLGGASLGLDLSVMTGISLI